MQMKPILYVMIPVRYYTEFWLDSFGRGVHGKSPEIGVIEKVKKINFC